jgi:hypothetical protein
MKYTREQHGFLYDIYMKRNPVNHATESFTVCVLVFVLHLHQ